MRANWFAKHPFFAVFALLCLSTLASAAQEISIEQARESAHLYFSANPAFEPEDLIARSQIEEFQTYLRKTRRLSSLTHPILLKQALADDSPLVQIFNTQGGPEVLRSAAEELGGYAPLEQAVLNGRGRRALCEAVEAQSVEAVIQAVEQFAAPSDPKPNARQLFKDRIYTVEDLLNRAFSDSE